MRYAYIPSATTARWREWVLSVIVALAVVCVPRAATAQEGQAPPGATTPVPASPSPSTSSTASAANVATRSPQQTLEPNAFPEGLDVVEVRVLDSTGNVIAQKLPAIPLSAGKPFDFDDERESLRALYRTGDYADVQASATAVPGGVRIDFTTTNNFYNNVVRVYGLKEPPTEAAALAAMRLGLGEPFRESSLREAIDRLKDGLQSEGIFRPR